LSLLWDFEALILPSEALSLILSLVGVCGGGGGGGVCVCVCVCVGTQGCVHVGAGVFVHKPNHPFKQTLGVA